jgi:hypothetical protein
MWFHLAGVRNICATVYWFDRCNMQISFKKNAHNRFCNSNNDIYGTLNIYFRTFLPTSD